MPTNKMTTLDSFSTIESADCVETCPLNPSIITCCTYQLVTNTTTNTSTETSTNTTTHHQQQQHKGTIYHFKIIQSSHLELVQTLSSLPYGIFDMKYHPYYPLLAVCQTNRTLSIYHVKGKDYSELEFICDYSFHESGMMTSVDWNDHRDDELLSTQLLLTCGDSYGHVHVLELLNFSSIMDTDMHTGHKALHSLSSSPLDSGNIQTAVSLSSTCQLDSNNHNVQLSHLYTFSNAHECECWTSAFHYFNSKLMYSGGDDSLFKLYDIHNQKSIFKSMNMHASGICCIQHSPFKEFEFYTGSYDDTLKVWDCRMFSASQMSSSCGSSCGSNSSHREMRGFQPIHTFELGGGVWNIKPNVSSLLRTSPLRNNPSSLIATATMYNGFHVLDISNQTIVAHYLPEDNLLSYGIDWCGSVLEMHHHDDDDTNLVDDHLSTNHIEFVRKDSNRLYLATCTFYDGTLRLIQMDLEE
ncbi:hypothetical protein C9374_006960 [Naegleria lovaniensis]|uniref:methylated diphthine methylhydrolase n=1 Tax=Naegleria lovaniensis TaxID=51637 RepID=A0AA88KS96_NAELO|nr:uncharacterized protein C9374_006960 [Naegleria lovaniensis]KAG2393429.1 hypothetical protein C9374_006960 [Naegleria lovaniensis]